MIGILQGMFIGLCLIMAFEIHEVNRKVDDFKIAAAATLATGRLECSEWMPNTATCVQWRFVSKDSAK